MRYCFFASPLGSVLVAGDEAGIRVLGLQAGKKRREPEPDWDRDDGAFPDERAELDAYFRGVLRQFTMRLAPEGTPFQRRVWQALTAIPYGETITYGELAERVGRPTAARAVGAANGANPIAIVIPCHRIIGADGSLVGYGGGLPNKEALLALERRFEGGRRPHQGELDV